MYDARTIANLVLELACKRNIPLTNLQIQKLVYFSHGYYLRETKKPLCKEGFEAWDFGPVSRTLYNALKRNGDGPVLHRIDAFDPIKQRAIPLPDLADPTAQKAVEKTVGIYCSWSAFDLVELTHSFGSPWSRTMELAESRANLGMKITDEMILDHFEGLEPSLPYDEETYESSNT
jgi:uncharacterized phage-associated protein